jgi:uncharacterized protein
MNETTNIELVKKCYDLFKSGDITGLLDNFSDDIKWQMPKIQNVPYSGPRQGLEAVREFFNLLNETEEVLKFEPGEFTAQDNRVVCLGKYGARVKETNRNVEVDWVHQFTIKDGKITNHFQLTDTAAIEHAYQKAATA